MTTIAANAEARLIKAEIELARAKSNKIAVAAGMKTECGLLRVSLVRNPALDGATSEISNLQTQIHALELRLTQVNGSAD